MSVLRQFARHQECTLRIPGVCNGNPETTVLCHGKGAGFGTKTVDYIGVHGCSSCHHWLDHIASREEYHQEFQGALCETLNRAREAGLI